MWQAGKGAAGSWESGGAEEGSSAQLGAAVESCGGLGSRPAQPTPPRTRRGLLAAESSAPGQLTLVPQPRCPHRKTPGRVCVSCRIQLALQNRTDNVEFCPVVLQSKEGRRNPPHPFMFQERLTVTAVHYQPSHCDLDWIHHAPCSPMTGHT